MAEREPFGNKVNKFKIWPPILSSKGQTINKIKLTAVNDTSSGVQSAINLGNGFGVYKQQVGSELEFKTLVAGTGISLSQSSETIIINSTSAGSDATNIGTGAGVFAQLNGSIFEFKRLSAGPNIVISSTPDTITISSSGGGGGEANTASNLPGGDGIFKQKVGVDLEFKSLVAGTNITLTPGTDTVTISASGGGGGEVNTASNIGTGAGTFAQKVGTDLEFRRINSNDFSVTENVSDITIDADALMITNQPSVTPAAGMQVLLEDSGVLKRADISSFIGGGGSVPNVQSFAVTPINLAITVGDYFYYIGVDSTIGASVVNLPNAGVNKYFYTIKDIGCQSNSNPITINATGGENIISTTVTNTSATLKSKGGALQFISDGSGNWWLH